MEKLNNINKKYLISIYKNNDVEKLNDLLLYFNDEVNMNFNIDGKYSLIYALNNNSFDFIEKLLQFKNINLRKKNKKNETILEYINEKKFDLEFDKRMIEKEISKIKKKKINKLKNLLNIKNKKIEKLLKKYIDNENRINELIKISWEIIKILNIKNYNKYITLDLSSKRALESLILYKDQGYKELNGYLRLNKIRKNISNNYINNKAQNNQEKKLLKIIKSIDKNMKINKKETHRYFYKGVSDLSFVKNNKYIDKGFVSITDNINVSKAFINKETNCCILKFKIPKGIKYFDYNDIESGELSYLMENELLLERGLKFEIIKKDKNNIFLVKIYK